VEEREIRKRKIVFITQEWIREPVHLIHSLLNIAVWLHVILTNPPLPHHTVTTCSHSTRELTKPCRGVPRAPLLHTSSSFSAKWRPEQEAKVDRWCPIVSPPALSSLLSLLIHLFGWIHSCMEPRWIIMRFLITPCICIPSYSLHGLAD
jgi:hypothetical protein